MKRAIFLSTLAVLVAFAQLAQGSVIVFDDLTETPKVFIDGIQSTLLTFTNETASFTFASTGSTPADADYGGTTGTYYMTLLNPATDVDAGTVSDIFMISVTNGSLFANVKFSSDPDTFTIPQGAISLGRIDENGNAQTVFTFTNANGQVVDTYQVKSDLETVPEPDSLLLVGSGALAVAMYGRKRRRGFAPMHAELKE